MTTTDNRARGTRRRAPLTEAEISQAASLLEQLAAQPKARTGRTSPLAPALERLKPLIHAAKAKGYSYEDIAEQLKTVGVTASPETIRRHAGIASKRASKKKAGSSASSSSHGSAAKPKPAAQKPAETTASTPTAPVSSSEGASVAQTATQTRQPQPAAHAGSTQRRRL